MTILEDKEDDSSNSKYSRVTKQTVSSRGKIKVMQLDGSVDHESTVKASALELPLYKPDHLNKIISKQPKQLPFMPLSRIVKGAKFG